MTADCNNPVFWSDRKEFLQRFARRLQSRRIPISGSIEITHRCNLNCVHCYIKSQQQPNKGPGKELGADEWQNLIDEMVDGGCLFLLITGGEPLLRPDFGDIYRYAREKGLLVTVFTNGTLVNQGIIELFVHLPPTMVEISLYGATSAVYDNITGVTGSFERCIGAIRKLVAAGIETRVKTVLLTCNNDELGQIEEKASELGSSNFRLDPLIMPGLDGNTAPLGLRVNAEEAVKSEFSDSRRAHKWAEFYRTRPPQPQADDRLYPCGAGLTSFSVDPYGNLKPCLMVRNCFHNIRYKGGFIKAWRDVIAGIREMKLAPGSQCVSCEAKPLCGYCPPFFKLETGEERRPPEYLCKIGQLRLKAVKNLLRENNSNE